MHPDDFESGADTSVAGKNWFIQELYGPAITFVGFDSTVSKKKTYAFVLVLLFLNILLKVVSIYRFIQLYTIHMHGIYFLLNMNSVKEVVSLIVNLHLTITQTESLEHIVLNFQIWNILGNLI